jgi:hypothetical protein
MKPDLYHCIRPSRSKSSSAKRFRTGNWLAEIPEQLETIQRLSEIYHASIRLHSCADAIIVAIFTVLERIVDNITRTWRGKSLISLSGGI